MAQLSQTQFESGRYREEDINQKARDLVRFFLASTGRKLPIKRQEIIEKVMKDMSRTFNLSLERARIIMEGTYGLGIVTLEAPNKSFCVVNKIDVDEEDLQFQWKDSENQQGALLMIVLSIIYMSGGVSQDEDLWKALKKLGLDHEKPDNEVFGDVKKLITQEFVQQGYIIYKRQPETDPPKYELLWGSKSEVITSREDVLSFVCQIFGGMEMFEWPQQFDAIHGEGAAARRKAEALSESQMEVDE